MCAAQQHGWCIRRVKESKTKSICSRRKTNSQAQYLRFQIRRDECVAVVFIFVSRRAQINTLVWKYRWQRWQWCWTKSIRSLGLMNLWICVCVCAPVSDIGNGVHENAISLRAGKIERNANGTEKWEEIKQLRWKRMSERKKNWTRSIFSG